MKKRILSLLLAVCLCVALLPTVALAVEDGVQVCGNQVYPGTVTGAGISGTVSWDNNAKTLSLTNATLNSGSGKTAILFSYDNGATVKIHLTGNNTINVADAAAAISCISNLSTISLIITGESGSSLTINMNGTVNGNSYGINVNNLLIDPGVTVTITAGDVTSSGSVNSYGVYCTGDLTVNGELTATGGNVTSNSNALVTSAGVCCAGNLTVNGKLRGTGGNVKNTDFCASVGVSLLNLTGTHTVNGTLTGNGGSATSTEGRAKSHGVAGDVLCAKMFVYGSLTGTAGVASGVQIVDTYGVTGGTIIVSGEKAELNASCDVPGTGASATANGEGCSSFSTGMMIQIELIIRDGAHVTAAGGTSVVSDTGGVPGVAQSNGISSSSEAKILVEGADTVLRATGNTGTESFGIRIQSADIRGGTVVCSGQKAGIWAGELNVGAQGQNVDFTASATGSDPWAALFLNKSDGKAGSLTLTHAQVVQPAESKIGVAKQNINEMSFEYQTILNADDKTAMEVHIVSGAADESLPGWLNPVIDAVNGGASGAFTDVKSGDWFYDAVRYVNEYGLMTGTADNCFSPNAPVTRGMVMTILARREGIKTNRYSPWYAAGVEWAKSVGISDGTNPEEAITREQLAVMLYRYAAYKGYDMNRLAELAFADANSVSDYATTGLRWAVGTGLMSGAAGLESGKLLPQQTATRAQLAAMLHRLFG